MRRSRELLIFMLINPIQNIYDKTPQIFGNMGYTDQEAPSRMDA